MNYDENQIIKTLRDAYWSPDEDAVQIWSTFKSDFAKKDPNLRRADLKTLDGWLAEQTTVTRGHAAMIQQKREFEDVHAILWRAGR
jgi:hypothetical protein